MRALFFDSTHIMVRQGVRTPTGIDRVDHAYASAFSEIGNSSACMSAGIQVALRRPRLISAERVAYYANRLSREWGEEQGLAQDTAYGEWSRFVTRGDGPEAGSVVQHNAAPKPAFRLRVQKRAQLIGRLLEGNTKAIIPQGALFLNVTQNPTLIPRAGRFLETRPDIKAVFLIHDLIPIDHPEYFPPARQREFNTVLTVILRHASALITTSASVRGRLAQEIDKRGLPQVPILLAPLPVSPGFEITGMCQNKFTDARYVVMVGTIEPRKNHWLILQLWRDMIRNGDNPPKLVIVGARGWGAEFVHQMLERTPDFAGHVLHLSGMSNEGLRHVMSHARALLMPSFVEGYGLPIIESAALGTPVISGNHPVFKEVSQGCAIQLDPTDGPGWREHILALAGPDSPRRQPRIAPLDGFSPPLKEAYFGSVRTFLADI
jgi:glycosyltransferase involved in cell wall biosynthesis